MCIRCYLNKYSIFYATIYATERVVDKNQLIEVIRGQSTKICGKIGIQNKIEKQNMKRKIKQHVTNRRQNDKETADSLRWCKKF